MAAPSRTGRSLKKASLACGKCGKSGRQLLVELVVRGQDRDQRGGGRLGPVALRHVRDQALAGLGGADQRDAQRRLVEGGRAVLDQVVDRLHLLVGHRLVGEGVRGAGLAEQQVLGGGVKNERHA